MDASDTRRGRPATHRAFEAAHRRAGWTGSPTQYGAAAAILLGDLLLTWADELLRRSGFGWDRIGPAMDVFDLCRSEVVAGQFLDVSVQARGRADVETAMTVLRYKSAKYSIERPLHVGAALAGAPSEVLEELTAFGLPLGEAFQLRDDQLGVFGDPEVTGKPAGDDLVEGKRTVLVALALDAVSPADAAVLQSSLGTALSTERVEELRGIIRGSGADHQVEAVIDELARLAARGARQGRGARRGAGRAARPRCRCHRAGALALLPPTRRSCAPTRAFLRADVRVLRAEVRSCGRPVRSCGPTRAFLRRSTRAVCRALAPPPRRLSLPCAATLRGCPGAGPRSTAARCRPTWRPHRTPTRRRRRADGRRVPADPPRPAFCALLEPFDRRPAAR